MEENTITNNTTPTGNSGNTMMFVIGAIVLAGILGYVIFSSSNEENSNTAEDQATVEESAQENAEGDTMETDNMAEDQTIQDMPEVGTMELRLDESATPGNNMDTTSTSTDVKVFEIEAGFPYFRPNLITVKKGDTVRVVMKSVDMMHNFVIDELGVKMPVTNSGETNTVEFTVNEAGSFEFYCSVGQHRQNGQFGTLVVQE